MARCGERAALTAGPSLVKHSRLPQAPPMTDPSDRRGEKPTREERLAAKLRENLRRRKAQGRELSRELGESRGETLPNSKDDG